MPDIENKFEDYKIIIPDELDHLIKGFLNRRSAEGTSLAELVSKQEWSAITKLGHKIKGHGGGYGFEGISIIGEKIETAAIAKNSATLNSSTQEYITYISYLKNILAVSYDLEGS